MKRIEMTPYEQKDILQMLDVALEEYKYRQMFDNMAGYWIKRIPELKKVIEGKVNPPSMERR